MKRYRVQFLCFLLIGFTTPTITQARKIPAPTNTPVSDFSNLLTEAEEQEINALLYQLYDSTTTQINVVTVPVAWQGYSSIEGYAYELATQWQIGSKEYNNGVLFLIVVLYRTNRVVDFALKLGQGWKEPYRILFVTKSSRNW